MKNESYNPFRMGGSYVGLISGFLVYLFSIARSFIDDSGIFYKIGNQFIVFFFVFLISGFLIGWGIHSIFRRFSNG